MMSSAADSLASTQPPPSMRPSTSGQKPCGSRTPITRLSSISTNENPPCSRGSTCSSASSRSRPSERGSSGQARAISSATSAESVVESNSVSAAVIPGSMPSDAASSAVFVRLPLWPSENPASPTERYTGCAFCHDDDPVVE